MATSGAALGATSGSGPVEVGEQAQGDSMWEVMRDLQERAARDFYCLLDHAAIVGRIGEFNFIFPPIIVERDFDPF